MRRELRDDIERLEVVEDLLGARGTEDDGGGVRVDGDPRERKVRHCAVEFCIQNEVSATLRAGKRKLGMNASCQGR